MDILSGKTLIKAGIRLLAVTSIMSLATTANALVMLDVGDQYYLGSIAPPTDAANETDYDRIVSLLTLDAGDSATLADPGSTGDFAFFDRTDSIIDPAPEIASPFSVADCDQGGGGNESDATASGCDFFIQKYFGVNGIAHVWDISGITDTINAVDTVPNPDAPPPTWQGNQWTAFFGVVDNGPCTDDCVPCTDDCVSVPEPGVLTLLGLGLVGLGLSRRS